jgi:hypothetical protein
VRHTATIDNKRMQMLVSGLLSLSIHEELTFEGTEIAIHPDLFTEPNSHGHGHASSVSGSAHVSISSSRHGHSVLTRAVSGSGNISLASLATAPVSGSVLPTAIPTPTQSPALHDHKHASVLQMPYTNELQTQLASVAGSSTSNSARLEVGNMIEIKVWDPKGCTKYTHATGSATTTTAGNMSAQPNSVKKRSMQMPASFYSQQNAFISGESNTNSAITNWLKGSQSATPDSSKDLSKAPLFPNPPTNATRTLDALISPRIVRGNQKQEKPVPADAETSSTESISETNKKETIQVLSSPRRESPVATERKGSNSLNVRPRPNGDTLRPGKPPLIQKKSATNALASTLHAAADVRPPVTKIPKPAHFRDISDMTMDTTLAAPATTNEADLGVQSMDSLDELTGEEDLFSKIGSTHTLRTSFVMLITERTLTSLKGQARTQISILRQIADLYHLSPYDMVTVNRVEKNAESAVLAAVSADFVFCTIKDQFISRGYMHLFQKSLIGRWIYEGERLSDSARGIKAHAREIRHADNLVKSGIITEDTKITFRSRSTRIIWLVQISSEMWDYSNPYELDGERKEESTCELVFDKFVRFMYKLFKKWKELEVTHSLTVVFFSRTLVNQNGRSPESDRRLSYDVYGRLYEDHYKTVVENETPSDWDSLIVRIKREFVRYPFDVGWDLSKENYRRPSTAMQGNLLEAINVTLNLLQFHFLDRDLHRTGNSVVVVSPECGVFEVDRALSGITYQRMMDIGIGSDMVCLGLPPLHVAPFFLYNNFLGSDRDRKDGDTHPKVGDPHSEVPHWMNLSFVRYDGDTTRKEPAVSSAHVTLVQPRDSINIQDGLAIAPNGFLIPEVSDGAGSADLSTLKSFTANNAGSLPGITKSQSQQRQLISGRDFKDILEACRPRTSTYILPSPLVNLLRIRSKQDENREHVGTASENVGPNRIVRHLSVMPPARRLQLREWGTVDFDDADGPMSFAGSGSRHMSRRVRSPALGGESVEQSDVSAKSSPSSSLASQLFGHSLDRAPSSFSFGLGGPGIQIQRSPSLDFETEPFVDDDPDVDAENFRKLMNEYDKKVASNSQTPNTARPALDLSGFVSSIMENEVFSEPSYEYPAVAISSTNASSGGLVAVLSKYKASDSSQGSREPLPSKTASSSGLSGSLTQLGPVAEASSRPLSYSTFAGMKVGSEPPGQIPGFPTQPLQAFMRTQQQMVSGSFDQRRGQMVSFVVSFALVRPKSLAQFSLKHRSISLMSHGPSANLQDRFAPRSPTTVGVGSPTRWTNVPSMPVSTMPSNAAHNPRSRSRGSKNMKSVVNPFRQQDEDDELEKKSHNRRRWSHVFPLGELEFKRHAGPLWKSLCQPAILPLTIDYFPTPQEMNDKSVYRYNHYQLTLQGMERTHYSSHRELLMEMVRQRITQDFQVVPPSVLSASNAVSEGDIQHTLSMGHRIHVLTYDSQSDTIDVKLITATPTEEDKKPISYCYSMYSPFTNVSILPGWGMSLENRLT